ncbi:MAG: MraY family glycosyltransferase [Chloroflexota bacterium]
MLEYVLALVLAFVLSVLLTPVARRLAFRLGSVHYPKAISIDTHVNPIPYLGGLPILVAALVTSLVLAPGPFTWWPVLVGAIVVAGGALIDDAKALSVGGKLISQFVAAVFLLVVGRQIIGIPSVFNYGIIDVTITFIWLVGMMNAVNFLDIMDGLAGGVSTMAAIGFAGIALLLGNEVVAIMALAVAGGSIGFLIFNFNPAKIFMGDTGSQFLGLMLAVFPLMLLKGVTAVTGREIIITNQRVVFLTLIVLAIPLFEMTFTSTIRAINGKAPWMGSKDHFPLRCFARGYSVRQIVVTVYGVGATLALLSIGLTLSQPAWVYLTLAALVVAAGFFSLWLTRMQLPKIVSPIQKEKVQKAG